MGDSIEILDKLYKAFLSQCVKGGADSELGGSSGSGVNFGVAARRQGGGCRIGTFSRGARLSFILAPPL